MPYLGIFWIEFKNSCNIWNQRPRIYLIANMPNLGVFGKNSKNLLTYNIFEITAIEFV